MLFYLLINFFEEEGELIYEVVIDVDFNLKGSIGRC